MSITLYLLQLSQIRRDFVANHAAFVGAGDQVQANHRQAAHHQPRAPQVQVISFRFAFHEQNRNAILITPEEEQADQINRRDELNNKSENAGNLDVGAFVDLGPGAFHSENPGEENHFDHREDDQTKGAGPEVHFIQKAVVEEKHDRQTENQQNRADHHGRFLTAHF